MADPNLQFIATRIRKIGLQSMTPARLYDLATDIGEHHYRELAADTAHEINTQLTPLEGYLLGLIEHLDKQGYDDAKLRRYAQSSLRGLKHLELLVRDLHMYSSTASGEDFEEVDLARLVEETLSIGLSHQRQTENESRIEVRASVPEGLLVEAMPSRLTRALTNLILNACQAMPNGGTLEIQAMILGSNLVEVTIRDAGRGMTSEEAEQAMKRFCTTRGNEGGTGLGLPIAQRIIELDHHGSLAIESTPGEGTRVVVSLPRRRLDDRG
jgi:signal transduction histidine kinase